MHAEVAREVQMLAEDWERENIGVGAEEVAEPDF